MPKTKAKQPEERTDEELRRGNVIVVKGGRALVMTPPEALDVLDALVEWAADQERRPLRIEV